jgi:hypothetical protein
MVKLVQLYSTLEVRVALLSHFAQKHHDLVYVMFYSVFHRENNGISFFCADFLLIQSVTALLARHTAMLFAIRVLLLLAACLSEL